MWSIFSRDPAKDFAYIIGEKVAGLEDKSVWSLHQGKKKVNVSVHCKANGLLVFINALAMFSLDFQFY